MHVDSAGVKADSNKVHPMGARESGKSAHTRSLSGIDTVYRIAGLSGRAHLYENTLDAVPGEQVELSSVDVEVAGQDRNPASCKKPCGDGFSVPSQPLPVVYIEISACSSCSTLTSRNVNT